MEKTVELKVHKKLVDGTTPADCCFTIGRTTKATTADNYVQQADFLLGDLIDIMQRIRNREPLDSIRSGSYPQSALALFNYLYDDSLADSWEAGPVRIIDKNEKYCSDVLELFDTLKKRDFNFSRRVFRGFKDYYGIRIPDCSVFYYHLREGLRAVPLDSRLEDSNYTNRNREYLEDYIDSGLEHERHYTFQCHSVRDVVLALLEYLAEEDYSLSVCARCNRLYSPVNLSSEKYCRRMYGDRECRKAAHTEAKNQRMQSDRILNAYQKKLITLDRRINGGFSTSEWCKEQKQILMDEYHQRRELMASGKMSEDDLLDWILAFNTKAPRENGSKK